MRNWLISIKDQWHPPRDRVLWAPVFLGAGVAGYFALTQEPSFTHTAQALALSALALIAALRRALALVYPVCALFLMVLGFTMAHGRTMVVQSPILNKQVSITRVEGRVLDLTIADDEKGKGRKKVTLDELVIEKLPPEKTPETIRLSTYHVPMDVVPGERIALLARLMPPSGPVAPEGFDYRRQAYFEQIGAVGFTMGKFERISASESQLNTWFNALRQKISVRIAGQLPHPESAVVTALLAGERANIPDDVNDDLRDSGLFHLLSISGLHVAIVCGVTFFVLRFMMALWPWMALHWPIKKIAALAALSIGIFYVLLAGAPIPAQRSIFMTGLVLVAVMLDRSALSMRMVALAAFFVLFFLPESLVGASFQLSFMAVLSMVAFHEGVGRKWLTTTRDTSMPMHVFFYIASIVITTLLVSAATLPPVLHHFGRLQIFGVIANAIAIPLTSFIVMPAGMAAMLVMPFGWEEPFLRIAGLGIDWTLDVAHWVAHLPHAAMILPNMPDTAYFVSCMAFIFLCLWRGNLRFIGIPIMVIALIAGFFAQRPIAMVDGEGRSIAIHADDITAYTPKTPTKYVRENWQSVWGGTEFNNGKPIKTGQWQQGDTQLQCDDFACRITQGTAHLSVLKDTTALHEECTWANAIVSLDKATPEIECQVPLIRFWDLREMGGVAFYPDGRLIGMTPANTRRPWTLQP